jgi:hypothetical protein
MDQLQKIARFVESKPRKGDPISYRGEVIGSVHRVEGALCWTAYSDGSDPLPFIWCFSDGLNAMHDWPTKAAANAPCPGLTEVVR